MRALQFSKTGALDHLALVDLPRPVPKAGEVLVKVEAAGLNPSDAKNVRGFFAYTKPPRIPGRDFAGTVVEGPPPLLGTRVFGTGRELGFFGDGTHAEFAVVREEGVVAIPSALSLTQAASAGVPYATAWEALERAGVAAGVRTLIIGAGAVGRAAIELARWRGAEAAVAVRKQQQADELAREDHTVVLLQDGPLVERLPLSFDGAADAIFDTTGLWSAQSVAALAPMGRIAIIAAPPGGRIAEFPALDLYRRGAALIGINSLLHDTRASAAMLKTIARGWQSGALKLPQEPKPWPFADALAAYRAVDAGGAGKIVLTGF